MGLRWAKKPTTAQIKCFKYTVQKTRDSFGVERIEEERKKTLQWTRWLSTARMAVDTLDYFHVEDTEVRWESVDRHGWLRFDLECTNQCSTPRVVTSMTHLFLTLFISHRIFDKIPRHYSSLRSKSFLFFFTVEKAIKICKVFKKNIFNWPIENIVQCQRASLIICACFAEKPCLSRSTGETYAHYYYYYYHYYY